MRIRSRSKRLPGHVESGISPIFRGASALSYPVAVSRLAADLNCNEETAIDQIDIAELRGDVIIDRVLAIVHLASAMRERHGESEKSDDV